MGGYDEGELRERGQVSGFREQGTGNREQGTGNREQGTFLWVVRDGWIFSDT
jgi:hypothetical protein